MNKPLVSLLISQPTITDFILFDIPELDFGSKIHPSDGNHGGSSESAYAGFVGRFNYGYANKYLAEFTFRYDGSYKFAEDNRWGFFPSVSLGYVLSEEDFFKSLFPSINYFKLRGSFRYFWVMIMWVTLSIVNCLLYATIL